MGGLCDGSRGCEIKSVIFGAKDTDLAHNLIIFPCDYYISVRVRDRATWARLRELSD